MKKLCMILAVLSVLSLAACGAPAAGDPAETVGGTAAVLEIRDIGYPTFGTIEAFQVEGTIVSGHELVRMEVEGELIAESGGNIVAISDDTDIYDFEAGTYEAELSGLTEYFAENFNKLYSTYLTVAVGGDANIVAKLHCTCYDVSEASESFILEYTILTEDTASDEYSGTISISGLEYLESGTAEEFCLAGTVSSEHPLSKIECSASLSFGSTGIGISNDFEPFCFEEDVYSFDLSDLGSYFMDQYRKLYDMYKDVADAVGAEDTVYLTLNCTCSDAAGKTVRFAIHYEIAAA